MKAMILAAGFGTRLKPLTDRVPKCMVPVRGKPLIEHTIEWLVSFGVTDIIMNVSHLGAVVMNHLGDGRRLGANLTYSIEDQPLGTAGGVRKASWFFDGPFLVWYGDNLSECNVDRLAALHRAKGGLATIALHHREDVTHSGIVEMATDDRIVRFVEKPAAAEVFSHWVNAGIYVLDPAVVNSIPSDGTPDFGRDIFPALLAEQKPLYGYRLSVEEGLGWIDRPEDLDRLSQKDVVL